MLKHFALFAVLFISLAVKGQEPISSGRNFEKGKYIVGLTASGNSNNGFYGKGNSLSVSPWAGYFVAKNLAVGLRVSYGREMLNPKIDTLMISGHNHRSLAPEVFLRYYVPKIKVKPFVQVSVGYNFQRGTNTIESKSYKMSTSNVIGAVEGGVLFPIGKRFSIDVSYNWRAFSSKKSPIIDANKVNSFRLGVSYGF